MIDENYLLDNSTTIQDKLIEDGYFGTIVYSTTGSYGSLAYAPKVYINTLTTAIVDNPGPIIPVISDRKPLNIILQLHAGLKLDGFAINQGGNYFSFGIATPYISGYKYCFNVKIICTYSTGDSGYRYFCYLDISKCSDTGVVTLLYDSSATMVEITDMDFDNITANHIFEIHYTFMKLNTTYAIAAQFFIDDVTRFDSVMTHTESDSVALIFSNGCYPNIRFRIPSGGYAQSGIRRLTVY